MSELSVEGASDVESIYVDFDEGTGLMVDFGDAEEAGTGYWVEVSVSAVRCCCMSVSAMSWREGIGEAGGLTAMMGISTQYSSLN